jgi:hypothetical protein
MRGEVHDAVALQNQASAESSKDCDADALLDKALERGDIAR